ncbi:uncharacterized protein LOC123886871 [Trifolium pratense]|uniref:uncharacterized protein LOC123886871 n=1 Tax=Trifolium pratense TaxID=57577 RepID=UPI001E6969C1|nr:uncharacterized protein LOC123886871 [Trifolium pratense]
MARKFESVKDINDAKDLWKISVKVKEKWTNLKDGKESIELLVVDDKGDDIYVFIPNELHQKFEKDILITVNNTYTMQNFQVIKNDDQFKTSCHDYKLRFNGGTLVKDVNVHQIPDAVTKYCWIGDQIGYSQSIAGTRKVQQHSNCLHSMGNYALKFFDVQNESKGEPIIVLMKYAKIKKEGKWPLTISNTWSTTKLFINEEVPEIVEFKKILLAGIESGTVDRFAETPSQMMSQSYGSSQYTPQQIFMHNSEIMPLRKMVQLPQETKCVTIVNTIKVKPTKYGWYYLTCFKCPRQCFGEAPPYKCGDDHETETEILRYKLDVEVGDGQAKATFVFWDRECEYLIGKSALVLRSEMLADGIHDPLDYPEDIDLIVGKTLAVKVKCQPKWKTGSVIQINQADDFINEISSQFPPTDAPQGLVKVVAKKLVIEDNSTAESVPPNICEVEAEVELQPTTTVEDLRDVDDVIPTISLFASDEIDPLIFEMKTPSKRSGNDLTSTSQDAEVEDFIGEKSSSTKLLKVGGNAAGKRGLKIPKKKK